MKKITIVLLFFFYHGFSQIPVSFYPAINPIVANFGSKVDLDGNEILVSNGSTVVYLFEKNDNGLEQKQVINSPNSSDGTFGYSISIQNPFIVIGDPLIDSVSPNSGSVFIYNKTATSYELQQTITSPEAVANYHFGSCVKVFGNKLFITAENKVFEQNASSNNGSVYYYLFNGTAWVFQQKLTAVNCTFFGKKIEVNNYGLVIYSRNAESTNQGIIYYKLFNDSYFNIADFNYLGIENNFDFSLSENFIYILNNNFVQPLLIELGGVYLTAGNFEIPQVLFGDFILGTIVANDDKIFIGFTGYSLQIGRDFFILRYRKMNNDWQYAGTSSGVGLLEDDYFGITMASKENLLVIGAPRESVQPLIHGNAYYLDYTLANESFENMVVSLFPNPTTNRVFISNSAAINKIEIYSVSGKLLQTQNSNFNEVSMGNLAKGLYFVKIYFGNDIHNSFKIVRN